MSKFWLYFGIFLACTGIGTIPGIILIVSYYYEDIKRTISHSKESQQNTLDPKYYDDETMENLK